MTVRATPVSLIDVRVPDDAALETLRSTPGVEPTGHGRPGWAGAVAGSAGLAAPTQTARRRARVTLRARGV